MASFLQEQIGRFLDEHQPAIAALLVESYVAAGGHYTAMSPEQRRRQAETDSGEYCAALRQGAMDRANRTTVQASAHEATQAGIDVYDILRMSNALEVRVVAFVQKEAGQRPDLANELIRRARNVAASFRANLVAARVDDSLRRLPTAPEGGA